MKANKFLILCCFVKILSHACSLILMGDNDDRSSDDFSSAASRKSDSTHTILKEEQDSELEPTATLSDGHTFRNTELITLSYNSFLEDISEHASLNSKHGGPTSCAVYLILIYESGCACSQNLLGKVENATDLLKEHFEVNLNNKYSNEESFYLPPMVGTLDVTDAIKNQELQILFDIDELPVLKLVIVEHDRQHYDQDESHIRGKEAPVVVEDDEAVVKVDDDEEAEIEEVIELEQVDDEPQDERPFNSDIYSVDYIGKQATSQDIFETVLHYWYRFTVAEESELSTVGSFLELMNSIEDKDRIYDTIPSRPLFSMRSMEELASFLKVHGSSMFRPSPQDFMGASSREVAFMRRLMKYALEREPHYLFVQCRHYGSEKLSNQTLHLYQEFEELALLYIHRKDVAFSVVVSDESCDWIVDYTDFQHDESSTLKDSNGFIRMLSVSNGWNDTATLDWKWIPQASFHPSFFTKTYQPASTNDIAIFNLTDFAIVHTTPSIMWLDRHTTATIAFPTYREIHFVLFIDAHSPRRKTDGSFDYDSKSFHESQRAIEMLYNTSQECKLRRPSEDVVFLIVPSTDVQILKTFDLDIWSSMDEHCTRLQSQARNMAPSSPRTNEHQELSCLLDSIPQLPSAMITSRKESSKYMKVYHLGSDQLLLNHPSPNNQIHTPSNPLSTFLNTYFDNPDALKPTVKSETIPPHLYSNNKSKNSNNINKDDGQPGTPQLSSGVIIATALTLESLVMSPNKHSILYLYTPTCGHCKRFHKIYNNFSLLVDRMNWRSQIHVISMDVSRNDVFLEVSVDHIPAVFFFHRGAKDRPQEMVLLEDDVLNDTNESAKKESEYQEGRIDHNLGGLNDCKVIAKWIFSMLGSEELQEWKRLALINNTNKGQAT